jgi:Holliday junction resolvasome RuvABC endonuclease subunit
MKHNKMKRERGTITNEKESFHVMALDPSLTAWGWVIMDGEDNRVLKTGCIKTEPLYKKLRTRVGDDRCRRINELNQQLIFLIKGWNVRYIVSEQPHGSQSAVSAIMVGITLGMGQTLSDALNIGIEWYSEGDAKKALSNKKKLSKQQTIEEIKKLYQVPWTGVKYKDEAVADAIAVYNVARQQSSILKFYNTM